MLKQILPLLLVLIFSACSKTYESDLKLKTPDWTNETHGNDVMPDYQVVFPDDRVLRFDITINADDWLKMQTDLTTNLSLTNPPAPGTISWEPLWVSCSFKFDGREWYKVGIRYKGNSTLKECIRRNIKKYSFKLDFDEFEGTWEEINDQRFYGFKQLNLSNGFDDQSLMREYCTTDLFREFGIPAPRTAFCQLWIDYGQGSKYFGLYTLIEEVDDTMIEIQFTGGGNLYKPENNSATFASGSYNTINYKLKTNTETSDYSDVRALYDAVNSSLRTTDAVLWKANLEKVFNVPHFLKWLAANTVIQNWDTYGKMSHNYYLYNNPANGLLTWIPWDNNEALNAGKQGGALSLGFTEVQSNWPLIRYLINDNSYLLTYKSYLGSFTASPFNAASFQSKVDQVAQMTRHYAITEVQGSTFLASPYATSFDNAVTALKQHVVNRNSAVSSFLAK